MMLLIHINSVANNMTEISSGFLTMGVIAYVIYLLLLELFRSTRDISFSSVACWCFIESVTVVIFSSSPLSLISTASWCCSNRLLTPINRSLTPENPEPTSPSFLSRASAAPFIPEATSSICCNLDSRFSNLCASLLKWHFIGIDNGISCINTEVVYIHIGLCK